MSTSAATILQVAQILVTLSVLYTFVRARKNEAEAQGSRQKELDLFMRSIQKAVDELTKAIRELEEKNNQLKLWLELLLQQHCTNHGQDIRR